MNPRDKTPDQDTDPAEGAVPGEITSGRTEHPDASRPEEFGGPKGPEPTRYGDWERKGRCIDF
ncbi:MAG: DUF1674 domain-containing protein [Pseudomonadota bacterium]|nr:DUF1674 domain-containing protein [Pseudomonadota bacterium]